MSGNGRGIYVRAPMLKEVFTRTALGFNPDIGLVTKLWDEVSVHYGHPQRHYHTLEHIRQVLDQITMCKAEIGDWDMMVLAVFYHDIVYNVLKNNNEEKSAALAKKRLTELDVPAPRAAHCLNHILATKDHSAVNKDAALLVDADLSIPGSDWDTYWHYVALIRKEYKVIPDLIFRPGRKKIVTRFLERGQIYVTSGFFHQYEMRARENLKRELAYWESFT